MATQQKDLTGSFQLTPELLLEGAFYATEQAWHLLEDSVLLFQGERYATSVILATYCLEELSRSKICSDFRTRVLEGTGVTSAQFSTKCEDHKRKLADGGISPLVHKCEWVTEPTDPRQDQRSVENVIAGVRKRRNRLPKDALEARRKALYVDLLADGESWNRPRLVGFDEAEPWLITAQEAYIPKRSQLVHSTDPEIQATAAKLYGNRGFPEPHWNLIDFSPGPRGRRDSGRLRAAPSSPPTP